MLHAPVFALIVAFLAISISPHSLAASEREIAEAQALYREHCRPCHTDGSAAGKYTPTTLIQSQWVRFFDRKYERVHRKVSADSTGNQPVTETIGSEDLAKIRWFAIEHAADTEQPMTCDD